LNLSAVTPHSINVYALKITLYIEFVYMRRKRAFLPHKKYWFNYALYIEKNLIFVENDDDQYVSKFCDIGVSRVNYIKIVVIDVCSCVPALIVCLLPPTNPGVGVGIAGAFPRDWFKGPDIPRN